MVAVIIQIRMFKTSMHAALTLQRQRQCGERHLRITGG